VARDLRVSVTDRCNFRCLYCMPEEGLRWLPRDEVLSFEEILRVVRLLVGCGIDTVRITGGEPLVRNGVEDLVGMIATEMPRVDLSMTTNGYRLAQKAPALAANGLRRVNVSLDSLRPARFHAITRREGMETVLDGIAAAAAAGLKPVKVNAVMVRGVNDDEAVDFARLARENDYHVRFIEFMPLDAGHGWSRQQVVPAAELLAGIEAVFPLRPVQARGPEPAATYEFADGAAGSVGVIASVTEPFCGSCDRLRLTADGHLRTCLFALDEHDLKTPLRAGASDAELDEIIRGAVTAKWAGHRINASDFAAPGRSMSQIGG
jgi:cyclic pyranopterin phosphate synthase